MGNWLSGRYGRRSSRPFFDQIARLTVGDCEHLTTGWLTATAQGRTYPVRMVRQTAGCMTALRLICARCGRACRVLYLYGDACCRRCAPARYRSQSEAPGRRAVRRAETVWRQCKHDFKRPEGKPKWLRWPTYERLSAAADAVWPIIERDDGAPYAAVAKLSAPRRKRGRPRKSAE
jgi:hypothetical protein